MIEPLQLHKKESKYDLVIKGDVYHLEVDPCADGFVVKYSVEYMPEIPDYLKQFVDIKKVEKIKKVVLQKHVHHYFYEKWLGLNWARNRVFRTAAKLHKKLVDMKKDIESAESIELELSKH